MKLKTHPHKNDLLTLTPDDLHRIANGETLQVSALVIELEKVPKPDEVRTKFVGMQGGAMYIATGDETPANLKLTFDGETGKLKSAEVL